MTTTKSPASTLSTRISRLETQVAGMKEVLGSIPEVKDKLDQLKADIEAITGTLSHLESRTDETSTPLEQSDLDQVGGVEIYDVPKYTGDRINLPIFLELFQSWAVLQRCGNALFSKEPVDMNATTRRELEETHGKLMVEQSLFAWSALTRSLERDQKLLDLVVTAGSPSEAWKVLEGLAGLETNEAAGERIKRDFEKLEMEEGESVRSYFIKARMGIAALRQHNVFMTERDIYRRVLGGLSSRFSDKQKYSRQICFDLRDLEAELVSVEDEQRGKERTDGGRERRDGGGGGRSNGRRGKRGKRNGKRRPSLQRDEQCPPQQHQPGDFVFDSHAIAPVPPNTPSPAPSSTFSGSHVPQGAHATSQQSHAHDSFNSRDCAPSPGRSSTFKQSPPASYASRTQQTTSLPTPHQPPPSSKSVRSSSTDQAGRFMPPGKSCVCASTTLSPNGVRASTGVPSRTIDPHISEASASPRPLCQYPPSGSFLPSVFFADESVDNKSDMWVAGSAATCHMTFDAAKMYDRRPPPPGREDITLGDGNKKRVECIGNIDLVFHAATAVLVKLRDVSYAPGLGRNFFSLYLVQQTHMVVFDASGTHIIGMGLTFPRKESGSCLRATRLERQSPGDDIK